MRDGWEETARDVGGKWEKMGRRMAVLGRREGRAMGGIGSGEAVERTVI